jgi:hypothetical protein
LSIFHGRGIQEEILRSVTKNQRTAVRRVTPLGKHSVTPQHLRNDKLGKGLKFAYHNHNTQFANGNAVIEELAKTTNVVLPHGCNAMGISPAEIPQSLCGITRAHR